SFGGRPGTGPVVARRGAAPPTGAATVRERFVLGAHGERTEHAKREGDEAKNGWQAKAPAPPAPPGGSCPHGYFSSTVITRPAGTFSSVCTAPLGQVTVSLSMTAALPNPKCTRPSSYER